MSDHCFRWPRGNPCDRRVSNVLEIAIDLSQASSVPELLVTVTISVGEDRRANGMFAACLIPTNILNCCLLSNRKLTQP